MDKLTAEIAMREMVRDAVARQRPGFAFGFVPEEPGGGFPNDASLPARFAVHAFDGELFHYYAFVIEPEALRDPEAFATHAVEETDGAVTEWLREYDKNKEKV